VGIHVPAKTPRAVVDKLHREIAAALKDAEVKSRFETLGVEPVGNTPEEFTVQVRDDLARWGKVVEAAKIKLD
jgi:tripartite-type tricarboxylate transporter receptor subunit TctC